MLKLRGKLFQKVLSGILVVSMLFSSATTVFAADENSLRESSTTIQPVVDYEMKQKRFILKMIL